VEGKTFFLRDGVWTDSTFDPDTMAAEQVPFLSDAYFALLNAQPRLGPFFALGDRVIVVLDGAAYEVTAAE
jgi:Ca-activated chloride channel family protein